jgi:hypothetical protein
MKNYMVGYKLRPGVIFGFSMGPDLDPRSPRKTPIKPDIEKYFVIDRFNQWVEEKYQVTEWIQNYAIKCKYVEKDSCGREIEGEDIRIERRVESNRTLLSTREYEVFVERIFKFAWPF